MVRATPPSPVGLGLFVRVGLYVHAGVSGLGVGRVAAALGFRVEGVLAGQASARGARAPPDLPAGGAEVLLLLRGVVVGVVRFVTLVVPSSSSPAARLGQGALVLLLPVNQVLSLGKSESCHTPCKTQSKGTQGVSSC